MVRAIGKLRKWPVCPALSSWALKRAFQNTVISLCPHLSVSNVLRIETGTHLNTHMGPLVHWEQSLSVLRVSKGQRRRLRTSGSQDHMQGSDEVPRVETTQTRGEGFLTQDLCTWHHVDTIPPAYFLCKYLHRIPRRLQAMLPCDLFLFTSDTTGISPRH